MPSYGRQRAGLFGRQRLLVPFCQPRGPFTTQKAPSRGLGTLWAFWDGSSPSFFLEIRGGPASPSRTRVGACSGMGSVGVALACSPAGRTGGGRWVTPPADPLPWTEVSLSVLGALREGLECADTLFPEASCTLLGITLSPSVLSLEPVGRGLTRGWDGPPLGTQTPVHHPAASEQGEPSAELHKFPKTRLGPPGMQHSSLLLAAANLC